MTSMPMNENRSEREFFFTCSFGCLIPFYGGSRNSRRRFMSRKTYVYPRIHLSFHSLHPSLHHTLYFLPSWHGSPILSNTIQLCCTSTIVLPMGLCCVERSFGISFHSFLLSFYYYTLSPTLSTSHQKM